MNNPKIYIPNVSRQAVGGGWTFLRNLLSGIREYVHVVDRWEDCDIFFVSGITMIDKNELHAANKAGKKIVLRVDNVPRKSRNKRNSPHERLKEFAGIADVVVYQSNWAKNYCRPLCGDGTIIYNGVDLNIFNDKNRSDCGKNGHIYLFVYHGNSELKGFWQAHYLYQQYHRLNPGNEFWFINDFGRDLLALQNAQFDFWNGENWLHLPRIEQPEAMAELLRKVCYLIYPSVADAAPNIVLEARACGVKVVEYADRSVSGTIEMLDENLDISAERMVREYVGLFRLLLSGDADI